MPSFRAPATEHDQAWMQGALRRAVTKTVRKPRFLDDGWFQVPDVSDLETLLAWDWFVHRPEAEAAFGISNYPKHLQQSFRQMGLNCVFLVEDKSAVFPPQGRIGTWVYNLVVCQYSDGAPAIRFVEPQLNMVLEPGREIYRLQAGRILQ